MFARIAFIVLLAATGLFGQANLWQNTRYGPAIDTGSLLTLAGGGADFDLHLHRNGGADPSQPTVLVSIAQDGYPDDKRKPLVICGDTGDGIRGLVLSFAEGHTDFGHITLPGCTLAHFADLTSVGQFVRAAKITRLPENWLAVALWSGRSRENSFEWLYFIGKTYEAWAGNRARPSEDQEWLWNLTSQALETGDRNQLGTWAPTTSVIWHVKEGEHYGWYLPLDAIDPKDQFWRRFRKIVYSDFKPETWSDEGRTSPPNQDENRHSLCVWQEQIDDMQARKQPATYMQFKRSGNVWNHVKTFEVRRNRYYQVYRFSCTGFLHSDSSVIWQR